MADTYQLSLSKIGSGYDPEDFELVLERTAGTECDEIAANWLSETYWVPQIQNGMVVAWNTETIQESVRVPCTVCVKPKLQNDTCGQSYLVNEEVAQYYVANVEGFDGETCCQYADENTNPAVWVTPTRYNNAPIITMNGCNGLGTMCNLSPSGGSGSGISTYRTNVHLDFDNHVDSEVDNDFGEYQILLTVHDKVVINNSSLHSVCPSVEWSEESDDVTTTGEIYVHYGHESCPWVEGDPLIDAGSRMRFVKLSTGSLYDQFPDEIYVEPVA